MNRFFHLTVIVDQVHQDQDLGQGQDLRNLLQQMDTTVITPSLHLSTAMQIPQNLTITRIKILQMTSIPNPNRVIMRRLILIFGKIIQTSMVLEDQLGHGKNLIDSK